MPVNLRRKKQNAELPRKPTKVLALSRENNIMRIMVVGFN